MHVCTEVPALLASFGMTFSSNLTSSSLRPLGTPFTRFLTKPAANLLVSSAKALKGLVLWTFVILLSSSGDLDSNEALLLTILAAQGSSCCSFLRDPSPAAIFLTVALSPSWSPLSLVHTAQGLPGEF